MDATHQTMRCGVAGLTPPSVVQLSPDHRWRGANLRSEKVRPTLAKIEEHRLKLASDKSPLATGDLGVAGIFDEGCSISDAVGVSKKKMNAEHLFSYTVLTEAKCCVETGTNVGISSSYIAAAMNAAGPDWQLHTLESSPYRIRLARDCTRI
ncbi:hypothetical protein [Rhizobium sullae]|uniref:hypothetical protein n=1 Tax=Rhizobium sullae TaxID=50338 RepID=UPI001FCE2046|nr:hypothetical protein [Rhizobium sullae]